MKISKVLVLVICALMCATSAMAIGWSWKSVDSPYMPAVNGRNAVFADNDGATWKLMDAVTPSDPSTWTVLKCDLNNTYYRKVAGDWDLYTADSGPTTFDDLFVQVGAGRTAALVFVAPTTGLYSISGKVFIIYASPTTINVGKVVSGAYTQLASVSGPNGGVGPELGGFPALQNIALNTGDQIVFQVPGGSTQQRWWITDHFKDSANGVENNALTITFTHSAIIQPSIGSAKQEDDGEQVACEYCVVTGVFGNVFYIQDVCRAGGIQVRTTLQMPAVGSFVTVHGTMQTIASTQERYIQASSIEHFGYLSVKPIGMTNKALGGSAVESGYGLNNLGLLVKTWGTMSLRPDGRYQLSDGSGVDVIVQHSGGYNLDGMYAAVTGVVSAENDGGSIKRLLLTQDSNSVKILEAPWAGNTIGVKQINDAPPSPWTPMAVSVTADALLVDCWGRRISFNRQSPLPTGMTSQGVELLNSPVVLKAGSESVVWQSNGVASSGPSGVVVEATGQIGGRLVYATTTIEFDGMMFTEIKPASGAAAWSPFSQLVIEVPMRRVVTPYMQKQWFMPDSSVVLNTTPGWSEDIGFQNYIWFGNDATGLSWFCESRRSWTASSTRQLGVENRGDATVLIVRIAEGSSAAITKLAFGLHPTPTRERPSKWRDISYAGGQKFNFIWASPAYYKYHGYPQVADNPASFISARDNIKNAGKLAIPYLHSSMLDINAPEYAYFSQEWENTGQSYSNPDGFSTQLVQTRPDSPGWNDFIVWRYKSFVEQYDLDGIYHDFAAPSANTNPLFPETLGDMPIRAWRDLYKRLYIMLKEMPKPTFYIQHTSINSGGLCSPLLSFCDMYVDNEQTAAVVEGNSPEWVYSGLPESYWRIRSTGKQYGCAPLNILIQNKFTPGCIGLQLLYDIHSSWGWFGTKTAEATAVLNNVETAMRTFGIGYDNVQYLPPWANTLVSLSNAGADVRVAAYMRGTKAMLVIVNGSTAAANNVGVTLKPETGLTIYGVKDAISQQTLTLSGPNYFTLNIGAMDFRMILLNFSTRP